MSVPLFIVSPFVRKIFKSLAPTEKETNARASSQPGSQLVCPPGPAASTLARGGLLEQYRCTWEGLDGGVGGRVRVSFLSLPFPAALAVGNFHGTLLLPRGLGCPVGSTNAKRQQRCFHGFVCNSSFAPRSVPGVAELGVLSYPCWDKPGSFSAVAFLQVLPCGAWHERHLDRLSFHLWTHRGNPLLIEQKAVESPFKTNPSHHG
ncbi:uncharacterized protein CCOS01_15851 [Colletotrichum costaricense]|uniref:Uncharacterized protein n=1 Tax=Colletotrichum costaricense TaxID=1209916 RepID=A0AAI9YGL8_9PEZI|nr:uncharacterized protein CCOS01_15851 [Colletotrichum costaricense]KAK1508190.1 hypothetical protein CCOS01_15851 [Colletotrichum costaricense]